MDWMNLMVGMGWSFMVGRLGGEWGDIPGEFEALRRQGAYSCQY